MEEDGRPTTAIDGAALRDLVAQAREQQTGRAVLQAALAAAPRGTEAIAPIVMIVDRPLKLIDGEMPGRPSKPVSLAKFRPPRVAAKPLDRRVSGVALPAPKPRFDIYVLVALLFVLAATLWMALA